MRALLLALALAGCFFAALPLAAAADPVSVHIQVIEASRNKGDFEARLAPLKKSLPGYESAKLIDEIEARVEAGGSVSLEILGRDKMLNVKVLKVTPTAIQLRIAIDALKVSTKTTHQKGNATFMIALPTGNETARFLAITPRFAP